jgi:hypothetical protein
MKKLLISLAIAAAMIGIMVSPVMAASEQQVGASVTVGEVISITLSGPGAGGVSFGTVQPGNLAEATGQSAGTPSISVDVSAETNTDVDISIKGTLGTGTLGLDDWKYCDTHDGTKVGLTDSDVVVYDGATASSNNAFYHWVDVPSDADAGSNSITITYKAVAD